MDILAVFSDNESLFSAIAALLVIAGFIATVGKKLLSNLTEKTKTANTRTRITLSQLSAPSPYPIKFADSEGINIAYSIHGKPSPTLIVTPGVISNLHVSANLPPIRDTMDALAAFSRVINFDKRGQGLSDPTSNVATIDDRVKDIGSVASHSGSEKFFLMGISEGGPMAVQYAVENPEKVLGLILFGTTAKFSRSEDFPMGFSEAALDGLVDAWGTGSSRAMFFPSIPQEVIDDATYQGFEKLMCDRRSMSQIVSYMKTLDVRPLLGKVRCPTLIMHFTGDLAIPIRMGRYLHSQIEGSEFMEIAGVDHCDLANATDAIKKLKSFIGG